MLIRDPEWLRNISFCKITLLSNDEKRKITLARHKVIDPSKIGMTSTKWFNTVPKNNLTVAISLLPTFLTAKYFE